MTYKRKVFCKNCECENCTFIKKRNELDDDTKKVCSICIEVLPLDNFDISRPGVKRGECRECRKIKNKERHEKKKEQNKTNKDKVMDLLKNDEITDKVLKMLMIDSE